MEMIPITFMEKVTLSWSPKDGKIKRVGKKVIPGRGTTVNNAEIES